MAHFLKVISLSDLTPGTMKHAEINNLPVALYNVRGKIYATTDVCTHSQCQLTDGFLEEQIVECPCHG